MRCLRNGINPGDLERPLFMQCTFASLSQWTMIREADHCFPHRDAATTSGVAQNVPKMQTTKESLRAIPRSDEAIKAWKG